MLSRITRGFGSIFTSLKNLVAQHKEQFNPYITFAIVFLNIALYLKGFVVPFTFAETLQHPFHLITYQFSHANLDHVMGNCLFLTLVGPKVEKTVGHFRFALIYLLTGVFSAIGFGMIYQNAPLIGASGAIAGIIAIYPFFVKSLYGMILTAAVIGFYFVQNFTMSLAQVVGVVGSPVACLAHVAGAVSGIILVWTFRARGQFKFLFQR